MNPPEDITFSLEWIDPCAACKAKGFQRFGTSTMYLPPGKEGISNEELHRALFGDRLMIDESKRVHDINDARVLADHEQAQRDRRPTLVKT